MSIITAHIGANQVAARIARRGPPGAVIPLRPRTLGARVQRPDNQLRLGSLRSGRLRVRSAFRVEIQRLDGRVVAHAEEINEFGFGANLSEAIADLQGTIAELYDTLESEESRLGPDLRRVWEVLRKKVLRRP
jgi:hypothetical protein